MSEKKHKEKQPEEVTEIPVETAELSPEEEASENGEQLQAEVEALQKQLRKPGWLAASAGGVYQL